MFYPIVFAVAGEGFLTLMDALVKGATARLPVIEVAFLRFVMGSVFAGLSFAAQKPAWPSREAFGFNAWRSVMVVGSATLFFYALSKLPIAECMALSFFSPMFIAFFGVVLLGERFDARIGAGLALGLVGMAIIVGGQIGGRSYAEGAWLGAAAVFVSAILYGLIIVLLRHRATKDPLAMIVLFQNVGPAVLLAVPAALVWVTPGPSDLMLFVFVGALAVLGHTCLATAFARAEAARLAPVHYTVLAWGTLYGYLLFDELPGLLTLVGAALIVLAVFVTRSR